MTQWHFSYDGKTIGPLNHDDAVKHARSNPSSHVWREGFTEWLPTSQVAEFSET